MRVLVGSEGPVELTTPKTSKQEKCSQNDRVVRSSALGTWDLRRSWAPAMFSVNYLQLISFDFNGEYFSFIHRAISSNTGDPVRYGPVSALKSISSLLTIKGWNKFIQYKAISHPEEQGALARPKPDSSSSPERISVNKLKSRKYLD